MQTPMGTRRSKFQQMGKVLEIWTLRPTEKPCDFLFEMAKETKLTSYW